MPQVRIDDPGLQPAESVLLRRYLTESHLFSGQEWRAMRQILDRLAGCEVQFGTTRYRLTQFYSTFINGTYGYPFHVVFSGARRAE